MIDRLLRFWVYGGALCGLLLAAITPVLARGWPLGLLAVWLQLPLYMLHQYEEHDDNRFAEFVNRHMAHGRRALTPASVFLINVPGVWGVVAVSWMLAATVRPGLGLIAIDLTLVNALAHIGGLIMLRVYNPGVITAVIGFIPIGGWALWCVQRTRPSLADHALGIGIALAIHIAIVIFVRRRASAP
ncbi:MAG TPA: HXXEE domain-containing protein [Terracidiphilus sp.]|nr:HXXEE domain-containing protein [Terracidiphilus sp.]